MILYYYVYDCFPIIFLEKNFQRYFWPKKNYFNLKLPDKYLVIQERIKMSGIMGILSDKSKLLGEYFTGYENLVNEIITHGEDLNYIYDKLDEMLRNYSDLLKLASRNLFYEFENKAPLAALALFGHSGIYEYYKNVYESAKIKDKKEILIKRENIISAKLYYNEIQEKEK